MPTYSVSAKAILDRIQGNPKGARHLHRYRQLFGIARRIRERMEEKNISVRELARAMGTSPSQVQRVVSLTGPTNLTLDTMMRAAEAVGLEVEFRLREAGQPVSYVQRGAFPTIRSLAVIEGGGSCVPSGCATEAPGLSGERSGRQLDPALIVGA